MGVSIATVVPAVPESAELTGLERVAEAMIVVTPHNAAILAASNLEIIPPRPNVDVPLQEIEER